MGRTPIINAKRNRGYPFSFYVEEGDEELVKAFDKIVKKRMQSNRSKEIVRFMRSFVNKYGKGMLLKSKRDEMEEELNDEEETE